MDYEFKLRNGNWQKKRLEIMQRDDFQCRFCGSFDDLQIHHMVYSRGEPWEIGDHFLITLCGSCHREEEEFKEEDKFLISKFVSTGLSRRKLYHLSTELRRFFMGSPHWKEDNFQKLMDFLYDHG